MQHCFFSGIAGTGMSALAQYLAFSGNKISGSDRSFDQNRETIKKDYFLQLGAHLYAQDGSGLHQGISALIVSTAIEAQNPEIQKARDLNIPILHRADLLAHLASLKKTIAIAGTSGKSTVTGMLFHILEAAELSPSLITGANLLTLQSEGLLGNAKTGKGDWLLIEADESDGSLVKYHPALSLILNIEKDHQEIEQLIPLFAMLLQQTEGRAILNEEDPACKKLHRPQDWSFTHNSSQHQSIENLILKDWDSQFDFAGYTFQINVPGAHNVANALAALTAARALQVPLEACVAGLALYRGVERRHIHIGTVNHITIVDDFAHNPAKVRACLATLKQNPASIKTDNYPKRILAIFHPHGFAPMKLMGKDIVTGIAEVLDGQDKFYMPEIYYVGGTADKSISSRDLIHFLNQQKNIGEFYPDKTSLANAVIAASKPGDWIVSMGARDPSLGDFAKALYQKLQERFPKPV